MANDPTFSDMILRAVDAAQNWSGAKNFSAEASIGSPPLSNEELAKVVQLLLEASPETRPIILRLFYAHGQNQPRHSTVQFFFSADQQQFLNGGTSNQTRNQRNMDPITLATAAVASLSPYLVKFGEHAAEKLGDSAPEAGGKLLAWLRHKLGGRGQEAIDDLVKKPESEDNQADLRKQLIKALEADPALAKELADMLPHGAADNSAMMQNVTGAGAKAAQIRGSGNITNIG